MTPAPCGDCALRPGEPCPICGAVGEARNKPRADASAPRKLRAPPSLQALVAAFGGYASVPAAAWASYDREVARWQAAVRDNRAGVLQ